MFLGFGQVVGHEVRLTDVLVGTTMAGIGLQGALIVREGERKLAALAVGVAEVVLDVGVARVAKGGRGKRPGSRPSSPWPRWPLSRPAQTGSRIRRLGTPQK